jgi:hypothetical protein
MCWSLCSLNQKLTLAHQQMNSDYEKLKQDEADKSTKLQELMSVLHEHNIKLKSNGMRTNHSPKKSCLNYFDDPFDITSDILTNKMGNFSQKAYHDKSIIDYEADDYPLIFTKSEKDLKNSRLHSLVHANGATSFTHTTSSNKSLLSSILSSLSLACPTLHLHIILSLTMVLITHQCPQYLIVV